MKNKQFTKENPMSEVELAPYVLEIMRKENEYYYEDFFNAYSSCIKEIISAAANSQDVKSILCDEPVGYNPLRSALKCFCGNGGRLFTSKKSLKITFKKEMDHHSDDPNDPSYINFNTSLLEDACSYLENVIGCTKMIIASLT